MKKKYILMLLATAVLFMTACKSKTPPADWKRNNVSNLGLSLETPFIFKEKNIESQLTPEVRKLVKEMHVFFEEQGESYFTATTAEYTDEVTISVQGAVDGAMNEMSNKAKGRIENRKDEERTINGHKANFTKATIARTEKDKMELQMVVLTKGQRIFQVMGLYRPDKDDIRKDVTRMIESIQLK
jgi:hypothetical protein